MTTCFDRRVKRALRTECGLLVTSYSFPHPLLQSLVSGVTSTGNPVDKNIEKKSVCLESGLACSSMLIQLTLHYKSPRILQQTQ